MSPVSLDATGKLELRWSLTVMLPAWSDRVGIICRLKHALLRGTSEGICLDMLLAAFDEQRSPVWRCVGLWY